jgi:hypothetical protein
MTSELCRLRAGAVAGLAGGLAFAAFMKLDIIVSRRPVDDFLLLGGVGPFQRHWRLSGPVIHLLNSVSLGALYALVVDRLPGPGWLRGAAFALAENTLLWPVVIALDQVHPAIRQGTLPHYNRPWPFVVENLRHLAYGLTLGMVFERIRPRG